MFSSLMGTSGSVRAYDSKVVNANYSFPFSGTTQGFSPLTLAPNGLLYSVCISRTQTAAPIQNTVILVVDPGKSNGRDLVTGKLESWSAAKAYLVGDNYTNRPQFVNISTANAETQYAAKGILAPNGLLYHTQLNGYGPASLTPAIPGLLIINPGIGLVTCTGAQGTVASTTLTITTAPSAGSFGIGQTITGTGIPDNTTITAFGTGKGGAGTYTISNSATIGSPISITGSPFPDCTWEFDSTFTDTRPGGNKFNGGILAPDNWIYLTPSRLSGSSLGSMGGSYVTRRIAPRSVAGGWTNPNNASTTTDSHETGYYNSGGNSDKNLCYFNTTAALSSKYFYPIDENGNYVTGPGLPAVNTGSVAPIGIKKGGIFGSSFYHPNGKIYYVGGGDGIGYSNRFIFYHKLNTSTWNTQRELVTKASLFIPDTLSSQNTFLSAQFEKPLDTVETTVSIFQVLDPTTVLIRLNNDNHNAAKFFEGMLIESTDNIFNGTTYVYNKTVSGSNVIITIKNQENTTPYNTLNPPVDGSNIKAKQDPQKLKVYLFRVKSTIISATSPQSVFGIYVFDPVTESVSLVSGTTNVSVNNGNNYAYPIVLPNGRLLRTASNARSNNIFTGTDSKLLTTPNIQGITLPKNGIPGIFSIPSIQSPSFGTGSSIPVAGNSLGKTYNSTAEASSTAGEIVSIKGYGPGIRFFNVTEEDLSYYTIPKTLTGEFDADNFATSYYNYFFNRPC